MKKVAVTGGVASGKSSVCQIFQKLGAYVVSADDIVHQLLSLNTKIGQEVVCLLGNGIVVNNEISRQRIAKKVFKDRAVLLQLEEILHPAVKEEIEEHYQRSQKEKGSFPLFIAEIPLLFESPIKLYGNFFDKVINVATDQEKCIERFCQTTGYDSTEFKRRSSRQLDPKTKLKKADLNIENNNSLKELEQKVKEIFHQLAQ